ncbi:hypothetical protein ACHAXA_000377 [Cyclostephanos tholiformis]|uniref:Uncharacterized protein n=1 Tax=Cyclostephanos tholiformis TaxID=382380 RepID=A0ABD3R3B4_9STRA
MLVSYRNLIDTNLPPASRALGLQVGRVVGLLRGARLRADQYATDHQLRRLQNEFKSGLRELDAVKAELAGSMTIGGGNRIGEGMGGLGASVPGVDRGRRRAEVRRKAADDGTSTLWAAGGVAVGEGILAGASNSRPMGVGVGSMMVGDGPSSAPTTAAIVVPPHILSPRSRSVAAVAEEEWERRGIGFRSIAEGGEGCAASSLERGVGSGGGVGGAVILSSHLRQLLIYDQYERTLREQDEALRSRIERVRNERSIGNGTGGGGMK